MCRETSTTDECNSLKEHIKQLEKEKDAQHCYIRELEEKNARLNALLFKKRKGQVVTFTLIQIVDYCKGCVEWADVKPVVMMLNKLLRRIGKEKDYDLVDSIEAKNYAADQYLIMKGNKFHTIANNGSKVPACKAVFSKAKANQ